eukprot:gene15596-21070_t
MMKSNEDVQILKNSVNILFEGLDTDFSLDGSQKMSNDVKRKYSVLLIQLKSMNRFIQLSLDEKRKLLDSKKLTVDKLQLQLENLQYRQSYLQREINTCKELATPNVDAIERELGPGTVCSMVYDENLLELIEKSKSLLDNEKQMRIYDENELVDVTKKRDAIIDVLSKKRKFMDDLPSRIESIKTSMKELE